jgi:ubiquitin C-terminal hydrolase
MDSEEAFLKRLLSIIPAKNISLVKEYFSDQANAALVKKTCSNIIKLARKLIAMDTFKIENGVCYYGFTSNAAALMIRYALNASDDLICTTKLILFPVGPALIPHADIIDAFMDAFEKLDVAGKKLAIENSGIIQLNYQLVSSIPPKALPSPQEQIALLRFYSKHEWIAPSSQSFACDILTRWVAGSFGHAVNDVILYISQSWKRNYAEMFGSLEAAFLLLVGDPIIDNGGSDSTNLIASPSSITLLFQIIPLEIFHRVPHYISQNSVKFSDMILNKLIHRLLRDFPLNSCVSSLIMQVLNGFCIAGRKNLLSLITLEHSAYLLSNLTNFEDVKGVIAIFERLVLGFQHSPAAFHRVIPELCNCLIDIENSSLDEKYKFIDSLCFICHVLLFKYPGFKDRYNRLQEVLSKFLRSFPDAEKVKALCKFNWSTSTGDVPNFFSIEMKGYDRFDAKIQKEMKGLLNSGNICYANSVIQVLYLSRKFLPDLSNSKQNTLSLLESLWSKLKNSDQHTINPEIFVNSVFSTSKIFRKAIQADAAEFLKFILDKISDELNQLKGQDHTFAFKGRLQTSIECKICKRVSNKEESFFEIDLFFSDETLNDITLSSMVNRYFSPINLENDDQYFCSNCECQRDAILTPSIIEFPQMLIISLKRFEYLNGALKKLMHFVDFPSKLSLPNYGSCTETLDYFLYACIVHSGSSAEHGHYYTIGRKPENEHHDEWFLFNDSVVEKITHEKILNCWKDMKQDLPYLYFFYKS